MMSVIVTFSSEFKTVITPQPSKIRHMFIWTFLITKTQEITSCSYALKSWNTLYIYMTKLWVATRIRLTVKPLVRITDENISQASSCNWIKNKKLSRVKRPCLRACAVQSTSAWSSTCHIWTRHPVSLAVPNITVGSAQFHKHLT
jgi:hypothetical protein